MERSCRYTFINMKDLKNFFSNFFTKKFINKKIKEFKKEFIPRPGNNKELNKLQFLKKCEWEFNRMIKGEMYV